MPSPARPLALALLALLLNGCGGGTPAPEPTATVPPTVPPTATAPAITATPLPAPRSITPSLTGSLADETACADPYPGGAPFEAEPGEAIRLRPSGSPPALAPFEPLPFATDAALEQVVRQSLGGDKQRFAVVVKNLADGQGVALAPERTFYAASLFKTWVMLEAYHQRGASLLAFDERYVVSPYYQESRLSAADLAPCSLVDVASALQAIIRVSDNVAANLLLDRVGAANVNAALRNLGLSTSGIPADGSLPTTAADMALLLEGIARRQAVGAQASEEMLALLASQSVNDRLPALLPAGTRVAHKTGNWSNATHDAGIVFSPGATYVIAVLSDFGFGEDGAGRIARLSRAVYEYYNPE
jgi:beta-lactamase class A